MPDLTPVILSLKHLQELARQQDAALAEEDEQTLLNLAQLRLEEQRKLEAYGPAFSHCTPTAGQLEEVTLLIEQLLEMDEQLRLKIQQAMEQTHSDQMLLSRFNEGLSGYTRAGGWQFPAAPRFFDTLS